MFRKESGTAFKRWRTIPRFSTRFRKTTGAMLHVGYDGTILRLQLIGRSRTRFFPSETVAFPTTRHETSSSDGRERIYRAPMFAFVAREGLRSSRRFAPGCRPKFTRRRLAQLQSAGIRKSVPSRHTSKT